MSPDTIKVKIFVTAKNAKNCRKGREESNEKNLGRLKKAPVSAMNGRDRGGNLNLTYTLLSDGQSDGSGFGCAAACAGYSDRVSAGFGVGG